MKKLAIKLLLSVSIISTINAPNVYAEEEINSNINIHKREAKSFRKTTIKFITDDTNEELKSAKIFNTETDFWDDFTIKLSNTLKYGAIDIPSTIGEYTFSHYEINDKKIESIDAILDIDFDNPIINAIYSKKQNQNGYLDKGYHNGLAIDNNYIKQSAARFKSIYTDLYQSTWFLEIPAATVNEIKSNNTKTSNINDRVLYLNIDKNPFSQSQISELENLFNYVDGINFNTSLGFKELNNPLILHYTLSDKDKYILESHIDEEVQTSTVEDSTDTENESIKTDTKIINLYGLNSEGKVKLISTSTNTDGIASFEINSNPNLYDGFFIAYEQSDINLSEVTIESESDLDTGLDNEILKDDESTDNTKSDYDNDNYNINLDTDISEIKEINEQTILTNEIIKISYLVVSFTLGILSTLIAIYLSKSKSNDKTKHSSNKTNVVIKHNKKKTKKKAKRKKNIRRK